MRARRILASPAWRWPLAALALAPGLVLAGHLAEDVVRARQLQAELRALAPEVASLQHLVDLDTRLREQRASRELMIKAIAHLKLRQPASARDWTELLAVLPADERSGRLRLLDSGRTIELHLGAEDHDLAVRLARRFRASPSVADASLVLAPGSPIVLRVQARPAVPRTSPGSTP